eukprot:12849100-Prorocentrum_lima.AAC.1
MPPYGCPHTEQTRKGSNQYQQRVRCTQCNTLLMFVTKGVNRFQADMCLVDARRWGIYSASDTLGAVAATSPGTPLSVSSAPSTLVTVNQAASQPESAEQ